jgi:molybdenum cofactor guanylyltransferase
MTRIAAAILAGGKATRLGGVSKGLLSGGDGKSIVARLIEQAAAAGIDDVIVSANDPRPYQSLNRPIIADHHADIGPLGGIEAVLSHLAPSFDGVVLLACDLPNVTACEILRLAQAYKSMPGRVILARTGRGDQPLCAVAPVTVLADVQAAIASRSFGVRRLWQSLGAVPVDFDDEARFLNINTPEDLRNWRTSSGETEGDSVVGPFAS